ncbi:MAG: hypothetical protein P9C48_06545 [Defluviicoccus sp.]|nr:hypothetical protein [Defluviicoccus sp.]
MRKTMISEEKIEPPPPTAPENIPVSALGFEDTETATHFSYVLADVVRAVSRYIDLSRLDGITIAYDYDAALAALDRGYEGIRPLTRTNDDTAVGVAMAPAVLRSSVVKGHLIFYAPAVLPIEDKSHEHFNQALYLIAHECAHIEDLKRRDDRFSGTILQQQVHDYEEALFASIVAVLWEEYAACRTSAIFGDGQGSAYEECLIGALSAARDEAYAAIRAYRLHGDIRRVLEEAGRPLCEPLRFAAYLLGHLDGRQEDWGVVPQARDRLAECEYASYVDRLATALRELWATRDSWESLDVFTPLKEIAHEVLAEGGMTITHLPDGQARVDIPFTPETMP